MNERKQSVGLATVRREMAVFRSLIQVGISYELIQKYTDDGNYSSDYNRAKLLMTHLSDHRPALQKRKIRPTLLIINKIKNDLDETMSDFVQAALLTAYRKSELLSLTKRDIDFDSKEIRLNDSKNSEGRITPMYSQLNSFMSKLVAKNCQSESDFIFKENNGKPLAYANTFKRWKKAQIKNDIIDENGEALYHFHDVRKTAIRYLIEEIGLTPEQVMDYFSGHKDKDVFEDIYNLRGYDSFVSDKCKILDL
jgi:integrase